MRYTREPGNMGIKVPGLFPERAQGGSPHPPFIYERQCDLGELGDPVDLSFIICRIRKDHFSLPQLL